LNPKLIYASISGYWQKLDEKAYDVIIQAESWLISLNWDEKPMKNATAIIDAFSWVNCAFAISSALYKRECTWEWEYIDVSMLWSALNMLENNLTQTSINWENPKLVWNHDGAISPFGLFKTLDSYIAVAIWNDNLWNAFDSEFQINNNELFWDNHLRLQNNSELIRIIEKRFSNNSTWELVIKLKNIKIPCSKVCNMKDLLEDEFLFEEKYLKKINHPELWECVVPYETIKFKNAKITDYKIAPKLGADNKKYKWENI
jgi:crotonobetainyl-CoA:carnitine CoA-transferase CaiB-like acyl-CoA transferase